MRGRIESVLDWAAAQGYRAGDNPARLKGHLDHLLPDRARVRRVEHHAAMPYAKVPEFMRELLAQDVVGARALEFTILTAARAGETMGAVWNEIDRANRMWTIPETRMKGGREHRVPLSTGALAALGSRGALDAFVFVGQKRDKPLIPKSMRTLLGRMGHGEVTVHGFRSSFRDWAAECTDFPSEVVEMALAHAVGNRVEAAYRRGDLFEKRRALMQQWGAFCGQSNLTAVVRVRSDPFDGTLL